MIEREAVEAAIRPVLEAEAARIAASRPGLSVDGPGVTIDEAGVIDEYGSPEGASVPWVLDAIAGRARAEGGGEP